MQFKKVMPWVVTAAAAFGAHANEATDSVSAPDVTPMPYMPKFEVPVDLPPIAFQPVVQPYVIEFGKNRSKDLMVICENGDTIVRTGGSRAWRNNNPGNIVEGQFTRDHGSIGRGGRFAVFPDRETGVAALVQLLLGGGYRNMTIFSAISKYAPASDGNNVKSYRSKLQRMTGLSLNMRICDLTMEQLRKVVEAICNIEGWIIGTEQVRKYRGR